MDDKNAKYKVFIIILLILLAASLYFGFIYNGPSPFKKLKPTENTPSTVVEDDNDLENKNEEIPQEKPVTNDTEKDKITAKYVEEIDGLEVTQFKRTINSKEVNIDISFNTTKTVVNGTEKEAVIYQIHLNHYLVDKANDTYYFDSGSEADAFAEEIKEEEVFVIKGEDNKEYLVLDIHNPNVFDGNGGRDIYVINDKANLVAKIKTDDHYAHELKGPNAIRYKTKNNYVFYAFENNKIYYLTATSKDNKKCNYLEFELSINNNKALTNKLSTYVGSDYEDDEFGTAKLIIN